MPSFATSQSTSIGNRTFAGTLLFLWIGSGVFIIVVPYPQSVRQYDSIALVHVRMAPRIAQMLLELARWYPAQATRSETILQRPRAVIRVYMCVYMCMMCMICKAENTMFLFAIFNSTVGVKALNLGLC